jgi:hypothetical protein
MSVFIFIAKVIFAAIEFFAGTILSLSIFRIPFRYFFNKTILISLVMAVISTYFREVIALDTAMIPSLAAEIVLIIIIFNIPFLYSLLVSIIGYLLAFLFETILVLLGTSIGITSQELMTRSALHVFVLELVTAFFMLLLVWYLQSRKIGFQFLIKHLSLKETLKGYNFLLSAILILGIIGMQLQLIAVKDYSLKIYFPIILAIILIVGTIISFIHNKKLLKQKYERLTKHEYHR